MVQNLVNRMAGGPGPPPPRQQMQSNMPGYSEWPPNSAPRAGYMQRQGKPPPVDTYLPNYGSDCSPNRRHWNDMQAAPAPRTYSFDDSPCALPLSQPSSATKPKRRQSASPPNSEPRPEAVRRNTMLAVQLSARERSQK